MKKLTPLLFISLALLSACGETATEEPTPPQEPSELYERTITLEDKRKVTCVVYEDSEFEQGGVTCDWESAAKR